MPWNNEQVLVDKNGKPIPQVENADTGKPESLLGKYGSTYFIQLGTIGMESWENTSGEVTFPSNRFGFAIVNDGTADLTFTINGNTRKVKPGEAHDSLYEAFTSVTVNATSSYRAEVLK
jgi:hypothetical protein